MADYPPPPDDFTVTDRFAAVFPGAPITEHHFLYGDAPHPATHAHTEAVVERIHALTPPSLVRMDRAEDALAAVVARRKLEHAGQFQTDQWWDLKRYEDSIVDRYIEAES